MQTAATSSPPPASASLQTLNPSLDLLPRICSLATVYPYPGSPQKGTFIRSRLQGMASFGRVTVVAPLPLVDYRGERTVRLKRTPSHVDGPVTVLHPRWAYPPGGGALNTFLLALRTAFSLWKHGPFDCIDAHFAYPEGVAASYLSSLFRVPFVVTLRGSEVSHCKYPLRRALMRWALKRASAVIAVSESLAVLAIQECGVSPDHVCVIPNGIDERTFFPRDRERSRREFHISADTRVIVSAGNLIELKGHQHTIACVRQLVDAGTDVQLYIAGSATSGSASFATELRELITDLQLENRVFLLGRLEADRLATLMSAGDVFCLASSREGSPNVVREALACGLPVVTTAVGDVDRAIPSNKHGIIVDRPSSLFQALQTALEIRWDKGDIAEHARSRSWLAVGREVNAVLTRVLQCRDEGAL